MRHIPLPSDEYSEVFDACISNLRDSGSEQNYLNARQDILDAGACFLEKVNTNQLSSIQPTPNINGLNMKHSMIKLYTDKLSKKGQPGRSYYDKWRSLAPNGRCPLCSVKRVATLDHYLSKSDFPIYSIFPFNLVPACRDCNTEKLSYIATKYAEETLHPYFDNIDDNQWLFANVNETQPPSFTFYILADPSWNKKMKFRVHKHMEIFNLQELFSDHAAEELTNISFRLNKLFNSGGATAVKDHLYDCMESCESSALNSWRTAIYKAMFNNTWFHSNGFKMCSI